MNVYIPLADGQHVPEVVLNTIKNQIVDCHIYQFATPGIGNSQGVYNNVRKQGECRSRNLIMNKATDVFVMIDRDIVLLSKTVIHDMLHYIVDNTLCGACAVKMSTRHHITIQCVMIRPISIEGFRFDPESKTCTCNQLHNHINNIGLSMDFYTDEITGHEIVIDTNNKID